DGGGRRPGVGFLRGRLRQQIGAHPGDGRPCRCARRSGGDNAPMALILLGAPLGNPADASDRLREVLASADVVAAEDTRRLARLARDLGVTVTGRVVSYFEGNEVRRTPELVALAADSTVALITDGGMPSVSDPGFRLVRAAIEAGVPVTAAPGPTAVTTALALS